MHRYKELKVWQESRILCTKIYDITARFPRNEIFGLTYQLRRASVSIPSNIAEGAAKSSKKEFSRYLEIALGSAYEIETQVLIATDLCFISEPTSEELLKSITYIIKMISKLINSI